MQKYKLIYYIKTKYTFFLKKLCVIKIFINLQYEKT